MTTRAFPLIRISQVTGAQNRSAATETRVYIAVRPGASGFLRSPGRPLRAVAEG